MSGLLNFNKNKAGNDGNGNSGGGNTPPPPSGTPFSIDILQLQPSRLNPRKTQHGKDYDKSFQSLKQSIKNVGLQSTLTVTKHHVDDEQYELYNGGNTRLRALTELYEEYTAEGNTEKANECRYQQVIYIPYTDDLDVLIKHMAENEERINMTFIDKARAVFQIRDMYLAQNDEDDISNNKLVKYIHSLGWTSVNQRAMTELTFAFEKLDGIIPLSLNNGLGRPKIQQLRIWLGYVEKYITWLIKEYDYDYSFSEAEELYFSVLSDCDDDIDPIDLNEFYSDYIFKLSDKLMEFDKKLKFEVVKFELENVAEFGDVLEERPRKELSAELKATSPVTPFTYPEPRNPREVKPKTPSETDGEIPAAVTGDNVVAANNTSPTGMGDQPLLAGTVNGVPPLTGTADLDSCFTNATTIITELLQRFDSKGTLKKVVQFGDSDDEFQSFTPYFTLDMSTKEHGYAPMLQMMLGGEWVEQYVALHFLAVYILYTQHYVETDKLVDEEEATYKFALKLWQEFCSKYTHYTGLCQATLINQNEFQKDVMNAAHELIQQHWNCLRLAEIIQDKEEAEAEAE